MRKNPIDPKTTFMSLLCILSLMAVLQSAEGKDIQWKRQVINVDSRYEAAGIGDLNGDGKKDIMSGGFWYEAPDWKKHRICDIHEESDYFDDFANLLQDVDGDGDLDVVSVTYFTQEILWRENPGEKGGDWPIHSIDKPGNSETAYFFDMNGDGVMDVFPNVAQLTVWFEKIPNQPQWIKHEVGKEGTGHGGGVGDVNGDGLTDFICAKGWFETAKNGNDYTYTWHPEFDLDGASVPVVASDVNGDGLNDIVFGHGHDYGLYWLEQGKDNGARTWTQHLIDNRWSQPHAVFVVDLDGDGRKELVTGKRYHAHNGHDPGGNDPRCIYYYTFDKDSTTWQRHIIEEGTTAGFGLMPEISDIDGDGDMDLLCPGKSGLYLFEQVQ